VKRDRVAVADEGEAEFVGQEGRLFACGIGGDTGSRQEFGDAVEQVVFAEVEVAGRVGGTRLRAGVPVSAPVGGTAVRLV
jgi:hypothetical protein